MRDGRAVMIKASTLSEADAKRLAEWKPAGDAVAATAGPSSVFDKILDGDLLKLDGKSLKSYKDGKKPKKYYVFYYTASWCPPCQKFTPSLVDFYNKNKNDDFEVILITSDEGEKAMEEYAEEKRCLGRN
ncbi:MAG: redoxin family protein [Akkermansiaceae bacterium]|nr:redoxin family protein [Akkermansiaceae bacterium]